MVVSGYIVPRFHGSSGAYECDQCLYVFSMTAPVNGLGVSGDLWCCICCRPGSTPQETHGHFFDFSKHYCETISKWYYQTFPVL